MEMGEYTVFKINEKRYRMPRKNVTRLKAMAIGAVFVTAAIWCLVIQYRCGGGF